MIMTHTPTTVTLMLKVVPKPQPVAPIKDSWPVFTEGTWPVVRIK